MVDKLKDAHTAIMASGVWICFEKQPTIKEVDDARRLLNQLTDELIKEKLDADTAADTPQE
jgi:hypothetical protein